VSCCRQRSCLGLSRQDERFLFRRLSDHNLMSFYVELIYTQILSIIFCYLSPIGCIVCTGSQVLTRPCRNTGNLQQVFIFSRSSYVLIPRSQSTGVNIVAPLSATRNSRKPIMKRLLNIKETSSDFCATCIVVMKRIKRTKIVLRQK